MRQKSVIFVVISALVVALMYDSVSTSGVFAVPPDNNFGGTCEESDDGLTVTCCWRERIPGSILGESYCQTCKRTVTGDGIRIDCDPKELQFLEQPPTPQPFDPTAPLQGGVLEQPPTPPPSDAVGPLQGGILEQLEQGEGLQQGFFEQQRQQPPAEQGAAQLPPATEGSQPATVEEEPPAPVCQQGLEFNEDLGFCVPTECPEGQELNEETGLCVVEEQQDEAVEEEPQTEEQTEPQSDDEEQTSDQEDSSEDSSEDSNSDN